MLIRASDNYYLINLDNIAQIFREGDNLLCTVPSANSDTGYVNIILVADNYLRTQYHIRRICYMYSQYVVNENGDMFIPPKVYTIDRSESQIITASQITASPIWDSARITLNNKASIGFIVKMKSNGKVLKENIDYTITLPYFRGQKEEHRFVFYFLSSNTYWTFGVTYTNGWKTFTDDIKIPNAD